MSSVCDSEGAEGLNVFYWSKFSAPDDVAMAIRRWSPARTQRRLPGSNKLKDSRNEERYLLERDDEMLKLLGRKEHLMADTSTHERINNNAMLTPLHSLSYPQ